MYTTVLFNSALKIIVYQLCVDSCYCKVLYRVAYFLSMYDVTLIEVVCVYFSFSLMSMFRILVTGSCLVRC